MWPMEMLGPPTSVSPEWTGLCAGEEENQEPLEGIRAQVMVSCGSAFHSKPQ